MDPTAAFHSITCCVAHLYVKTISSNSQQRI